MLGADVLMTRVTTQPASVLDERLGQRTAGDPQLAATAVLAIDDLACDREAMARVPARERLARALVGDLGEPVARTTTSELFAREHLGIHTDPMWRVVPSQGALARPLLAPVPISAMVRASLSMELETPANLRAAAERLSRDGRELDAFTAWCEYARHVSATSAKSERTDLQRPTGEHLSDTILRLRAIALGARDLAATPDAVRDLAGMPHAAHDVLAGAERVTIFAGAAGSMTAESRRLLQPMFMRARTATTA